MISYQIYRCFKILVSFIFHQFQSKFQEVFYD